MSIRSKDRIVSCSGSVNITKIGKVYTFSFRDDLVKFFLISRVYNLIYENLFLGFEKRGVLERVLVRFSGDREGIKYREYMFLYRKFLMSVYNIRGKRDGVYLGFGYGNREMVRYLCSDKSGVSSLLSDVEDFMLGEVIYQLNLLFFDGGRMYIKFCNSGLIDISGKGGYIKDIMKGVCEDREQLDELMYRVIREYKRPQLGKSEKICGYCGSEEVAYRVYGEWVCGRCIGYAVKFGRRNELTDESE